MISTLRSRQFLCPIIMTDGEGAIGALATEIKGLGIELDISGAGGHVARIERRIRMVKERVRAHMSHKIPYALTTLGIAMLVLFCVSRINFQISNTRNGGPSPREIFTGRRVDGRMDFRAGYGDYAQCTVANTDNTMASRTEDCIVVLPTGNRTGTVKMMSIVSGRIVSRDQFKILPMPTSVIMRLNDLAKAEGRGQRQSTVPLYADSAMTDQTMPSFIIPPTGEVEDPITQMNNEGSVDLPRTDVSLADEWDASERGAEQTDNDGATTNTTESEQRTDTDEGNADEPASSHEEPPPGPVRRSMIEMFRTGGNQLALSARVIDTIERQIGGDLSDYVMNITVKNALKTRGEEAERVIIKELKQMLDKKVWRPVMISSLSSIERSRIIRSQMFLKEKYFPTGEYEKLKARLVAGGDQQDKELYEDLSSPTVSTSAVLTVLSIAALEERNVSVVDITGAYLNADIGREVTVHMRLDKTISHMMRKIQPDYGRFADSRECIVMRLEKALYGCVESAALWHEHLSNTLSELGYGKNKHEWCVFNRTDETGIQCTVALHVDDLLITSKSNKMIDALCTGLKYKYGEVTRTNGPVVNYLGMVFDMTCKGEARVSMKGYVDDVLNGSGIPGVAKSPATDGLFEVREKLGVSEDERSKFHSLVAKLLYLAKRTKPECLTAVSFLATRVTKCTEDDIEKLVRLVRYIRYTKERGIVLRPGQLGIKVRIYIDAAYGVHIDRTSHTGSCVVIGDVGSVHCKSSKQSATTKSSTEAELMAVSDSMNQALYLRWFLIDQGYSMEPVTVYQDNTSTMALLGRGKPGAERTRHIDIRHFWIADRVKAKEAVIVHLGTKEMYANILTKPLQGAQFVYERLCLTGWSNETAKVEK